MSPTAAGPQFPSPTMRQSPNSGGQGGQGMTVAQKLYASSGNSTAPMISLNSISGLLTSVDAASSPSQPPASNKVSMLPSPSSISPLGSESSRPTSHLPQSRHSEQDARMNPQNNYWSGAALYAFAPESSYSPHSRGNNNSHRAASAPAFRMPTNAIPERLPHSQSVGSVAPNSYSTIAGPHPTPNLLTKATPPSLDIDTQLGKVDFVTTPAPLLSVESTSPSTSLLFSNPAEEISPSSYPAPPLSNSITLHNVQPYNHFGQQSSQLGRVSDVTLGTNGCGLDAASLLAMLKTALSMSPIAESSLRAVAYADLNADYQAVLNALKHQQRYRPTTPTPGVGAQHSLTSGSVDYRLLITEVGRLETKAKLAQQPQVLQQQQQHATLALQQVVLNQQAQEQALLRLQTQQQQQATLTQQQAILKHQADEQAALKLHLQQQQQQILAQQQANQIHQQQLHALQQQQAATQQLQHQQQQQQGGLGSFMSSILEGGSQQSGQGNSAVPQLLSHFMDSAVNSFYNQGPGGSADPPASGATPNIDVIEAAIAQMDAQTQRLADSSTTMLNI